MTLTILPFCIHLTPEHLLVAYTPGIQHLLRPFTLRDHFASNHTLVLDYKTESYLSV